MAPDHGSFRFGWLASGRFAMRSEHSCCADGGSLPLSCLELVGLFFSLLALVCLTQGLCVAVEFLSVSCLELVAVSRAVAA